MRNVHNRYQLFFNGLNRYRVDKYGDTFIQIVLISRQNVNIVPVNKRNMNLKQTTHCVKRNTTYSTLYIGYKHLTNEMKQSAYYLPLKIFVDDPWNKLDSLQFLLDYEYVVCNMVSYNNDCLL